MNGECFSGIGERYRSFTWAVKDFEQVHAGCHHADLCLIFREPEAETCPEQKNGQEWEGEQQQIAATPAIDGEQCRNGEHPVQDTCTHAGKQGGVGAIAGLDENCGRVVSDDIDLSEISMISRGKGNPGKAVLTPQNC